MPDFPKKIIDVRYASDSWGSHNFDFEDALPEGVTISSVVCKTFLGKVDEDTDLSNETESTDELIDTNKTDVVTGNVVGCYFNYPTTVEYMGEKHTLIFILTLSNGATHPFYHHYIEVH